jgi:ligand-binding sensor domain-containing protein/serine/threonine protein kinase
MKGPLRKDSLSADSYRRIREVFEGALERPREEREAFLEQACDSDDALHREVCRMLQQNSSPAWVDQTAWNAFGEILDDDAELGAQVGPYRIEGALGAGGMGRVYRATDTRLGRQVALKISRREFGHHVEKEARAISAINHPHICTIHDVGPNYLVMELVSGPTLAEKIHQGPIPWKEALCIAIEIVDALVAAHSKQIRHGDLKPGNIMLDHSGRVKVLDFGLATQLALEPPKAGSEPNLFNRAIAGTTAYISPEQVQEQIVDARSDIFSFGVVLYEMLSGHHPFQRDTVRETLAAISGDSPAPLRGIRAEVPRRLESVVLRCLEKTPALRYDTAKQLHGELEAIQRRVTPMASRTRMALIASLVALSGIAGFAILRSDGGRERLVDMPGTVASIEGDRLMPSRYNFQFYGAADGLENLAIQVVLQDRVGYLWTGTQNGLFRFDGNRFTAFGKGDGLPGNRIESLHESTDGTLWVGTRQGLAIRSGPPNSQRPRFDPVTMGIAAGVVGREAIASDDAGHVFAATEHGLAVGTMLPQGWVFRLASPAPGHGSQEPVNMVYTDSKGAVWYGCASALCRLSGGQTTMFGAAEGLLADVWKAILEDQEGNLWVRSERQLAVMSPSTHRFQLRTHSERGDLPPNTITFPTLATDQDGALLVPTNLGLARQTAYGWELVGAEEGLTTNDVSVVQHDREGSIWVGLLGSGLARWLGYPEWQSWTQRDGLSRDSVWAATRDRGGRLWVGTLLGLDYAEEKNGQIIWHNQAAGGVKIRALAVGSDGTVWVGGNGGGLRQLDPRTGSVTAFGASEGLAGEVLNLTVARQGPIWVATRSGIFRSAATDSGSVKGFQQVLPSGAQSREEFRTVIEDSQGHVWACGEKGLARYSDGEWTRYTTKDGLEDNGVAQVAEDADGSIWVGYYDAFGLSHITFKDGHPRFEHFSTTNGLGSNKTLFLGQDSSGRLWVGTDRGVDVYDHARWRHLGRSDGLIWDDTNSNAFLAERNGSVWIGTSRGISRFQARSAPLPTTPPKVEFASVRLGGEEVDPLAVIQVPYSRNSLMAQFAALSFARPSDLVFRYRLDRFDRNWVETRRKVLIYVALAPGKYKLEVVARRAQGDWSAEPARLQFEILTPWFLSLWFRLSSFLIALALGYALWTRRRHRTTKRRHRWIRLPSGTRDPRRQHGRTR